MVVKSRIFQHRIINTNTWTFPDGKIHKHIDHILIDGRWYSSILNIRSFRGADCNTDQYMVVEKVRERFSVSKQEVRVYVFFLSTYSYCSSMYS
jgi:hypothetical protein